MNWAKTRSVYHAAHTPLTFTMSYMEDAWVGYAYYDHEAICKASGLIFGHVERDLRAGAAAWLRKQADIIDQSEVHFDELDRRELG